MALTYDLSTDIRFKQGFELGLKLATYKLILAGFSFEQIAEIFDVTIEKVEQVAKTYQQT